MLQINPKQSMKIHNSYPSYKPTQLNQFGNIKKTINNDLPFDFPFLFWIFNHSFIKIGNNVLVLNKLVTVGTVTHFI